MKFRHQYEINEEIDESRLVVALICFMIASMSYPCAASGDYTYLMRLITDNEDILINAQDLAFLLVTHGFDAAPEESYAIVKLNNTVYKMIPNGETPGLADVSIIEP